MLYAVEQNPNGLILSMVLLKVQYLSQYYLTFISMEFFMC